MRVGGVKAAVLVLIASLLTGCAGGGTSFLNAVPTANHASGVRRYGPTNAQTMPIDARTIPVNAQTIPIESRLIPINWTTTPNLAPVCGLPLLGGGACNALRRLDVVAYLIGLLGLLTPATIPGYQPADLVNAYNVPSTGGSGQTIGIVIAYSDPNLASDLATYRSTFGLPPCTTASHCLTIINGAAPGAALPAPDSTWSQEVSIDVDMASAICPKCKILVSDAVSSDIEDLTTAMQTAIAQGATVVSNSYTTPETATVAADNPKWNHPGIPIVVGAGDSGYGVGWPASSSYVTAVAGTNLTPLNGRTWLENVWSDTGSGCSGFIAKPAWQHDSLCSKRTVADTAAIANPVPGVAVYDTYFPGQTGAGWNVYGGTSVATPIVAAMYALAGNGRSLNAASSLYGAGAPLNKVLSGSNGSCGTYLCNAGQGYNGPSGMGTPNGTAAY
jgi:hypothetical protein